MGYVRNSNNPLRTEENLFREDELGLDYEVVDYILENNQLQLRMGGDPFYVFKRSTDGSLIELKAIAPTGTLPLNSYVLWQQADGDETHPNIRYSANAVVIKNNSLALTRVFDKESLASSNEFAIEMAVGTSSATAGTITVWFGSGFIPGTVDINYTTICACSDVTTGYPNRECKVCFGTSYPLAFTQQLCVATEYNPSNTFLIRVPMRPQDEPVTTVGRVARRDLNHWMMPDPYVTNYDIIVGTIGDTKGLMWEIINKSDSRWRGVLTHQQFSTTQIDEHDIRYKLVIETFDPIE